MLVGKRVELQHVQMSIPVPLADKALDWHVLDILLTRAASEKTRT